MKVPQELDDRWIIEIEKKPYYSRVEVCLILTMSRGAVGRAMEDGHLSFTKHGREVRISHQAIIDYIQHRLDGKQPPKEAVPEYVEPKKAPKAAVGLPEPTDELVTYIRDNFGYLGRFNGNRSNRSRGD